VLQNPVLIKAPLHPIVVANNSYRVDRHLKMWHRLTLLCWAAQVKYIDLYKLKCLLGVSFLSLSVHSRYHLNKVCPCYQIQCLWKPTSTQLQPLTIVAEGIKEIPWVCPNSNPFLTSFFSSTRPCFEVIRTLDETELMISKEDCKAIQFYKSMSRSFIVQTC